MKVELILDEVKGKRANRALHYLKKEIKGINKAYHLSTCYELRDRSIYYIQKLIDLHGPMKALQSLEPIRFTYTPPFIREKDFPAFHLSDGRHRSYFARRYNIPLKSIITVYTTMTGQAFFVNMKIKDWKSIGRFMKHI